MPQLIIEITENTRLTCSQDELLDEANAALLATGQFGEPDIKSRCVTLTTYRQGTENRDRAFVHATVWILDGREQAVRKRSRRRCAVSSPMRCAPAPARACRSA